MFMAAVMRSAVVAPVIIGYCRLQRSGNGKRGHEGQGSRESDPARDAVEFSHDDPPKGSAGPVPAVRLPYPKYTQSQPFSCAAAITRPRTRSWRK
jgi:hypothetical protein